MERPSDDGIRHLVTHPNSRHRNQLPCRSRSFTNTFCKFANLVCKFANRFCKVANTAAILAEGECKFAFPFCKLANPVCTFPSPVFMPPNAACKLAKGVCKPANRKCNSVTRTRQQPLQEMFHADVPENRSANHCALANSWRQASYGLTRRWVQSGPPRRHA